MVTYGSWPWTQRALEALAARTPVPHEVIVVDNASADGTPTQLREHYPDVRRVANAYNAGFGAACNQGAEAARSPLLCLLNSDAVVEAGWLDPLYTALTSRPDIGAAVPCVLELDGRVQCAGALVGRDGTVLELGNGGVPHDPALAFPRAVDFGPAACIVIDREAFLAAGGFDPVYAPAYYEDADLCLTLAARGLRTVYVPAARVRHARYGSGNAEMAHALSERNRAVFAGRWADALHAHPATLHPPTAARILAARDASCDGRVLAISATPPDPDEPLGVALLAVQARRPWARITLLVRADDGRSWLDRGIEVLTLPVAEALQARRFHYDAVLAERITPELGALLRAHQPQAGHLAPPPEPDEVPAALAAGGLADLPADVLERLR
jgi:GT2 family glycosyltransferase